MKKLSMILTVLFVLAAFAGAVSADQIGPGYHYDEEGGNSSDMLVELATDGDFIVYIPESIELTASGTIFSGRSDDFAIEGTFNAESFTVVNVSISADDTYLVSTNDGDGEGEGEGEEKEDEGYVWQLIADSNYNVEPLKYMIQVATAFYDGYEDWSVVNNGDEIFSVKVDTESTDDDPFIVKNLKKSEDGSTHWSGSLQFHTAEVFINPNNVPNYMSILTFTVDTDFQFTSEDDDEGYTEEESGESSGEEGE